MPDPRSDLEAFAELSAELSDPFVPRAAALSAAGIDGEAELTKIMVEWRRVLAESSSKRSAFQTAFSKAREKRIAGRRSTVTSSRLPAVPLSGEGTAPPLLLAPEVPTGTKMRGGSPDPLDVTGEIVQRVLPVMPFVARDELGIPVHVAAAIAQTPVTSEDTGTVALPPGSGAAGPATPFESRITPAAIESDEDDLDATVLQPASPKRKP